TYLALSEGELPMKMRFQIAALLAVLLTCSLAFGQAATASSSLAGTVQDKTGAVITGATVVAAQNGTGLTRSTTTGDTGNYRFDLLPPGVYTIRANKAGFAVGTANNVELLVSRTTTQDFSLNP